MSNRAAAVPTAMDAPSVAERVASLDWTRLETDLNERGCATAGPVLTASECGDLSAGYALEERYRSRVVMSRHGFGKGEYKYYRYPLPDLIAALRLNLYPRLAGIANRWEAMLGRSTDYPLDHEAFLARCRAAGQNQPTPLLLRYGQGDYNCLHQDLYGDIAFPMQVAFLLSAPGQSFTGGEFVLTEQRPRMQSRVEVVSLCQGEGVVFAVNQRPVKGTRGVYRVAMRHGVSRLHAGERFTLGIIFHDAR